MAAARSFDRIERRIISELQSDGRMSATELARRVGASDATVRRKLRGLLDSGALQIVAGVNPFDVGYETPAVVFLTVDRSRMEAIAAELCEHPRVRFVAAATGRFDLIVEIVVETNQDLADFLLHDLAIEGIRDSDISLMLKIYMQRWNWGVQGVDRRKPSADD